MNKETFLKAVCVLVSVCVLSSCGGAKKVAKPYNEVEDKIAKYEKDGWSIHGSTRTLRGKLTDHYAEVEANNLKEISGTSTGCRSITVCRAEATNAAMTNFITLAGTDFEGKVLNNLSKDLKEDKVSELNNFRQGFIGRIKGSVRGELKEALALVQTQADGKSNYEIIFTYPEKALENLTKEAMKKAMRDAIESAQMSTELAKELEKYINE